jgi:hypothetical protein
MKVFQKILRYVFAIIFVTAVLVLNLNAQNEDLETPLPPKKAGVKRVGVLLPKVNLNDVSEKVDPAVAIQNTFAALLNSESIELIPLDARLNALALKEALDKECDYILKIDLTQKQKKKGGGFFNRILDKTADSTVSDVTSKVPTSNKIGGDVGRETAVDVGQEINQVEFTISKKDEFILDYELSTPKAKAITKNSLKAKAEKDDDDVLMPLIEKAANEIAEFLLR